MTGSGQLTFGGSTSLTVTLKLQVAVLPTGSVAVQVTVVMSFGKADPDGGLQVTVAPEQTLLTVGSGKVTKAEHFPGSVAATMSAAQTTSSDGPPRTTARALCSTQAPRPNVPASRMSSDES